MVNRVNEILIIIELVVQLRMTFDILLTSSLSAQHVCSSWSTFCFSSFAVPGSVAKKPRNRNIFSSFFCCFGAQSAAAGGPYRTAVTHTNHNHNHNENSLNNSAEEKEPKVGVSFSEIDNLISYILLCRYQLFAFHSTFERNCSKVLSFRFYFRSCFCVFSNVDLREVHP